MDAVSYSHADKQKQRIEKVIAEPDSASGLVTMPKTIASGEVITIPEDRIVVHPGLQVDGTLEVYGDLFVPSGGNLTQEVRQEFVATAGQTVFVVDYPVGMVNVFLNGVKLASSDYTATNGTSVVLAVGAEIGDEVEVLAYGTFELADAVSKSGDETIAGIKTFASQPAGIVGSSITNTPAGNIASTTVQGAINELDTEKLAKSGDTMTGLLQANGGININGNAISTGQRKNYLINGNFDMWQYGTSQTTLGYASDDRWLNDNSGSTKTHSQVTCTDTERAFFNASYFSRSVVSSVAGAGNYTIKVQKIENVSCLSGKTVTLSFWAKADTNRNIAIDFSQAFGTGGTSMLVSLSPQLISLNTTWQKKTATLTLPTTVGKTLGANNTSSTYLWFWFEAGSNYDSRTTSLGHQSGTFDIAQVKLEDGSVATDGWHPYDGEFGGEIQACQRYLPSFECIEEHDILGLGQCASATAAVCNLSYMTTSRVSPTGIIATGSFYSATANTATNPATLLIHSSTSKNTGIILATTSGLVSGNATALSGSVGAKILFTGCEL